MNTLQEINPARKKVLNRATVDFSPLAYLNVIERGSTQEWAVLYDACKEDAETKQTVIELLPMADPIQSGIIELWINLLANIKTTAS